MIQNIQIHSLLPHEEINTKRLEEILLQIQNTGGLDYPIIIDRKSFVILDGHHRYNAAKKLGLNFVPCFLVDYDSPEILLSNWREKDIQLTKQDVINMAKSHKLHPAKTTKHTYLFPIPSLH